MRFLSKIIFINSAHVRYSEIQVDGNVHLTGTQGVGKSTLLRALLFFYNADKQHLGIKQGQEPFDQFYFENANSYIVYEIQREIGAYTIIVSRHQGSASFRFIDAPYNKCWLIDETGNVLSEWVKIRQNIMCDGTIDISPRIDNYQNYRDIIFGNTHDRTNKFSKYALVESTKYQNIPRSIQNVFLNSKLDAEFVKKTIIESMTEGDVEESIKLSVYRNLMVGFERQYDDISIWYKKEKNGDILVRRQAKQVVATYHETIAFEQQVRCSVQELNYAVQRAREQLPIAQNELSKTKQQINLEQDKKKNIEIERDKELKKLNEEIGKQKYLIDSSKEKRMRYATMDIESKMLLHQSEPKLQNEYKHQKEILDTLTKQYADVEAKYKNLLEKITLQFDHFKNLQETELNRLRDEIRQKREYDLTEKEKLLRNAETGYNEVRNGIDNQIELLQGDKNAIECKLKDLHSWQPYATEKETIQNELQHLKVEEKESVARKLAKEQEMERMRAEALTEQETCNNEYKIEEARLQREKQQLQAELDNINELLSHYKGSLYEWLTQNKPQWEKTIGRVIDEERVLYSLGLSPIIKDESTTLYGVEIDVSQLKPTHRSPDEYRRRSMELQEKISAINSQKEDLYVKKEQKVKKIAERLLEKLKPIKQEITNYRVRIDQIPLVVRDKRTVLETIERNELEERGKKVAEAQKEYDGIVLKLAKTKNEKETKHSLYEKEKSRIDANFKNKGKELEKQLSGFKARQKEELEREQEKYLHQKRVCEAERNAELQGKSADVSAIKKQEEIIERIDNQLKEIDRQRRIIIEYLKDKEELFDREDSIKQEKVMLEEKAGTLKTQYEAKVGRISAKISELNEKCEKQEHKIKEWNEGLSLYNQIIEIEHLLIDSYLQDIKNSQNNKSCQFIISELRGAINDRKRKQEELKRNVNSFNSHFTPDNIFHFSTTPVTDEDYIEIALSLQEFIDNNKIEEYRKRTSEHYHSILQGISREVGNLMTHQSEIEKVINEINRDFIERNFAGVIKGIELRAEQSDNIMMRLLQKIKVFTDENSLNMGEPNLFSDSNHDDVNRKVVDYLIQFMKCLQKDPNRQQLSLSDTFNLQFRVKENDQDTGWVERINNVGSDGTDILVKAMINIMLINVFKSKAMHKKKQDFIIHCMMDEIGKLHSNNVRGILHFANQRNIYLINSSPESLNAYDYKYTYMLSKDAKSMTIVTRLLKNNQ